jgi:hypothetical protein
MKLPNDTGNGCPWEARGKDLVLRPFTVEFEQVDGGRSPGITRGVDAGNPEYEEGSQEGECGYTGPGECEDVLPAGLYVPGQARGLPVYMDKPPVIKVANQCRVEQEGPVAVRAKVLQCHHVITRVRLYRDNQLSSPIETRGCKRPDMRSHIDHDSPGHIVWEPVTVAGVDLVYDVVIVGPWPAGKDGFQGEMGGHGFRNSSTLIVKEEGQLFLAALALASSTTRSGPTRAQGNSLACTSSGVPRTVNTFCPPQSTAEQPEIVEE